VDVDVDEARRPEPYIDVIEDALVEAGREAAVLSALDVQTILAWQQAGIPLAVALKGIRQGVHVFERTRRAEDPFPRRVAYFSTWVNKGFGRYRQRVFERVAPAGGADAASETGPAAAGGAGGVLPEAGVREEARARAEALTEQVRAAVEAAPAGHEAAYAALASELEQAAAAFEADPDRVVVWAHAANQRLTEGVLAGTPPEERAGLLRTAEASVRAAVPLASDAAVARRVGLEVRRLLEERRGARFLDLRELTR
jgi:hypothetical protein